MPSYDPTRRVRSRRAGRMRGCTLDIPGEVLQAAGFSLDEPPPFYRLWPGKPRSHKSGGRVMVQLYREAS
jgi:hypothetical protein